MRMSPRPSIASSMSTSPNAKRVSASSTPSAAAASNLSRLASMRRLIKQRDIVVDEWRYADEDPLGRERALILPFARWKEERERWWLWDGKLGVRLGPTDPVAALEHDFLRVALVALEFGGLAEGRGYSQAQLLRKRYKFTGELRAVGKIQRDQLFYMARCGFDAFELPQDADLKAALAAFDTFSVAYQPAVDHGLELQRRAA